MVASDRVAQAWDEADRVAHEQVVALLSGEGGTVLSTEGTSVVVDLGPVIEQVKARLAARGSGLGVAGAMILLGAGLLVRRAAYLAALPGTSSREAATLVFDTLVRFLRDGLRATAVAGVGLRTGPVGPAVYAHRPALRAGVAALAAAIVVFRTNPTAGVVLRVGLWALALLAVLELLARPAGARTSSPSDDDGGAARAGG